MQGCAGLSGQSSRVWCGLRDSLRLEAGSSCTVHGLFPGSVRVLYWAHALPGLEAGLLCIRVQGIWLNEGYFVSVIRPFAEPSALYIIVCAWKPC